MTDGYIIKTSMCGVNTEQQMKYLWLNVKHAVPLTCSVPGSTGDIKATINATGLAVQRV